MGRRGQNFRRGESVDLDPTVQSCVLTDFMVQLNWVSGLCEWRIYCFTQQDWFCNPRRFSPNKIRNRFCLAYMLNVPTRFLTKTYITLLCPVSTCKQVLPRSVNVDLLLMYIVCMPQILERGHDQFKLEMQRIREYIRCDVHLWMLPVCLGSENPLHITNVRCSRMLSRLQNNTWEIFE